MNNKVWLALVGCMVVACGNNSSSSGSPGGSGGTAGVAGSDAGASGGTAGTDAGATGGSAGTDAGATGGSAGTDAGATGGSAGTGGASGAAGASGAGGTAGTGGTGGASGAGGTAGTGGTAGASGAGGTAGTGGTAGASGAGGSAGASSVAVDNPDPTVRCNGNQDVSPITMPSNAAWATSVLAYSSQWDATGWAATQATGAPNVYPSYGDQTGTWATSGTTTPGEYISVGFSPPASGSAIWIVETYTPDAVSKVTITTASGDSVVYQNSSPTAVGTCDYVLAVPTNTTDPISAVRVDLASDLVPGWNEIDAIGIVP